MKGSNPRCSQLTIGYQFEQLNVELTTSERAPELKFTTQFLHTNHAEVALRSRLTLKCLRRLTEALRSSNPDFSIPKDIVLHIDESRPLCFPLHSHVSTLAQSSAFAPEESHYGGLIEIVDFVSNIIYSFAAASKSGEGSHEDWMPDGERRQAELQHLSLKGRAQKARMMRQGFTLTSLNVAWFIDRVLPR